MTNSVINGGPEFGSCHQCGLVHTTAVCPSQFHYGAAAAAPGWYSTLPVTQPVVFAPPLSADDIERIAQRVAELLKADKP